VTLQDRSSFAEEEGQTTDERDRVDRFGRLDQGLREASDSYHWGPYLSERQWASAREDNTADGAAREYPAHDRAGAERVAP
jgi:hypothetical protein